MTTSPMMQQWRECKQQAKEALLLFRLGDFYEAFYEDAKVLANLLDITLTQRQGVPMSGIPAHACENYLEILVSKGKLVAIAEQVTNPQTKGLIERKITRTVSPSTFFFSKAEKENNFFASLHKDDAGYGLSLLDLSTSTFRVIQTKHAKAIEDELLLNRPKELLFCQKLSKNQDTFFKAIQARFPCRFCVEPNAIFDTQKACFDLCHHFKVHSLDTFGLKGMHAAISAAGALLHYVKQRLYFPLDHVKKISLMHLSDYMAIDRNTQRNLELTQSLHPEEHQNTLLRLLDKTHTPMGSRLLKFWLSHPLLCKKTINKRLDSVEELLTHSTSFKLQDCLKPIRDLERLSARISTNLSTPKDLIALLHSLRPIPSLLLLITQYKTENIQRLKSAIFDPSPLIERIETTLEENPPLRPGDGNLIRTGFHAEIDKLRLMKRDAKGFLASYQEKLRSTLGIKTLKISYNRAFGYFIDVPKAQAEKLPSHFIRKQTLVNNERFICPKLKELEEQILKAEEHLTDLEQSVYKQLCEEVMSYTPAIKELSLSIATLDALLSFAVASQIYKYTRPEMAEDGSITIEQGRHPVIEQLVPMHTFIANDTRLTPQERLGIITGPNMAGKSTYLRQVALISVMAQSGCFIPAKKGRLTIVDRLFSRIGAGDDLSKGQSTFMVEMTETASILHNATNNSLVILDEIGRGTSTYDGIAIAWSVAKHLLNKGVKTLFATHYGELTALEKEAGAFNLHVAVEEALGKITFLHCLRPGGTDKSYGIHVGKLAGLPQTVLQEAHNKLVQLTKSPEPTKPGVEVIADPKGAPTVPKSFDAVAKQLIALNIEATSPMQALQMLLLWQQRLKDDQPTKAR